MSKSNIRLLNFFIFNPLLGQHEGEEHKKLLYYYPEDSSLNTKIKHIGLAEAIIRFSSTFTNSTCENLHTLKTRQLYYESEKNYWFVMTVSVPFIEKNGEIEYLDENINDLVYQSILIRSYKIFKLFNGTIEHILKTMELEGLKLCFTQFFNNHLLSINFYEADINNIFQGLQFLPLDRTSFIKIQSFVNHLEEFIPQISHSVIICNKQLIWSGIKQEDVRVLYNYLITNILNNQNILTHSIQAMNFKQSRIGCFLLGPMDLQDESSLGSTPRVFLSNVEKEAHHLAVYNVSDITLCLFIDGSFHLHFDFFRKLDNFLANFLDPLALHLKELINKRQIINYVEASYRYIYFNHVNLAQKSTVNTTDGASSIFTTSPSTANSLTLLSANLYHDFNWQVNDGDEEIIAKSGDVWLCLKKTDERDVIVLINNKHASIVDIEEELRKICSTQFNNIFYPD